MRTLRTILPTFLVLCFATTAHATDVSGVITTQTWTAAGSPYHVTGEVTVPAGETLIIEAGVDVLFDVAVPFNVYGNLIINGRPSGNVHFTPGASEHWRGVRVVDADLCWMEYARVSGVYNSGGDAHGGMLIEGASTVAYLNNCVFAYNEAKTSSIREELYHARGGGVKIIGADVTMVGCDVRWNTTRSTHLVGWMGLNTSTTGAGGGVYAENARLTLTNSLVTANTVWGEGGGLYLKDVKARIKNCTIAYNAAAPFELYTILVPFTGAGIGTPDSSGIIIRNSVLWGNVRPVSEPFERWGFFDYLQLAGGLDVRHSCIQPATNRYLPWIIQSDSTIYPGEGNIADYPLFADTLALDFSLLPGSPCIGAGIWDEMPVDMGVVNDLPTAPMIGLPRETRVKATMGDALRIYNFGDAELTIDNLSLPAEFQADKTFPISIEPGGVAPVGLAFTGSTETIDTAYVSHNDSSWVALPVVLHGIPTSYIAGIITDSAWTKAGSPYFLVDDAEVPVGKTLRIEPGVHIIGRDGARLIVRGSLVAEGTETDSIYFEPSEEGTWEGLHFTDGGRGLLHLATIRGFVAKDYAGVWADGNGTVVNIERSYFSGNRAFHVYCDVDQCMYAGVGGSVWPSPVCVDTW